MRAMILEEPRRGLQLREREIPIPNAHSLLVRVEACGLCRTDLHVVDGELTKPKLPLIPGHQIVGQVIEVGKQATGFRVGERVGIPWLGRTCGHCRFCLSDRENLCRDAEFTGYQLDGGFAEYATADSRYVFAIPNEYDAVQAAPLLCAGIIGYRSLTMAGAAMRIGLYGFGAAAHILAQVIIHQGRYVYAFTSPGDEAAQEFARSLGAVWAGSSLDSPPEPLEAAIIFAPVGELVPLALAAVDRGGTVVCAGIHMSDLPGFPYALLWHERTLRSVANMTREDGDRFFELTRTLPLQTHVTTYELADLNRALDDLRGGKFEGAAVIVPGITACT
jgi:propanol-preferring alcohol dehydrogenase